MPEGVLKGFGSNSLHWNVRLEKEILKMVTLQLMCPKLKSFYDKDHRSTCVATAIN